MLSPGFESLPRSQLEIGSDSENHTDMKNITINFLKYFWLPIILLVGWVLFLKKLNIVEVQTQQIVLGIVLGTSLGFISEILRKSWDDFQKKNQVRKVAKTLLAQDALSIYQTMELYKSFMDAKNVPKDINKDRFLPPAPEMGYWKRLSADKDYILLAGESPFDKWYKQMFSFEKLCRFAEEAEVQAKDQMLKEKPMVGIYIVAYRDTVSKDLHKQFALQFHDEDTLKKQLKTQ